MSSSRPRKEIIICTAVFAVYITAAVIAGLHHEAWSDEAQSWLIARDNNSIIDIIKAVRYEGTLPTWHLILKLFQIMGLKYEYLFVVPLLFSSAGVILLFMTDAPLMAKIMIPFSFFVLYQNAVVARQYSLVFPIMMLIVLSYKDRYDHPARYYASLILLGLTSSYGVIISSSFLLWDFICMAQRKYRERITKMFRILFYVTVAVMLLIVFASIPPSDCSFELLSYSFTDSLVTALLFRIDSMAVRCIILVLYAALFVYCFRARIAQALVIAVPVVLYMLFFYVKIWHTTYLFCLVITLMMILRDDPDANDGKACPKVLMPVRICVIALLGVQCAGGVYSVCTDYMYPYYPSEEVAEYLRPYVDSGAVIDRIGFAGVCVQPYYDSNIYSNCSSDKSYKIWSIEYPDNKLSSPKPDIIISSASLPKYEIFSGYRPMEFKSRMIFGFSEAEDSTVIVWTKETDI